jgi:hypothetical protein
MRYRRTRTSSLDGPQGVLPQQAPGAPAVAPHPTHILGQGQGQSQAQGLNPKSSQGWTNASDQRGVYPGTGMQTSSSAGVQGHTGGSYAPSLQQSRVASAGAKVILYWPHFSPPHFMSCRLVFFALGVLASVM